MRGGIIWRLSLSHASSSEESALLGPTKYTTQQGISVSFQDGLFTLEELDAICGTYECLTGAYPYGELLAVSSAHRN